MKAHGRPSVDFADRLYLIGYRGTGKSTVGRLVAARLGWAFVDADEELERRAGRTIADIFRTDGEPAFRDLEAAVLADLAARPNLVVATGGGVILRPTNRELLRASGFVAWLRAAPETVWARLQGDPTTAARRPNLASGGRQEIIDLMAAREPFYRETADAGFDAAASPDAVADAILAAWTGSPTCRPSCSP